MGELDFFSQIQELQKSEEEERKKLDFGKYLKNLQSMAGTGQCDLPDQKTLDTIRSREQILYCKEPLEFIDCFRDVADSQEKCQELFRTMVESRQVVQEIHPGPIEEGFWFNTTSKGINLRPGLEDEEWTNPSAICLGDDCVHGMVAGRTGSGKSVFLNHLLFTMMAEYAPWELNLFLADFKKVELSRYLTRYPAPHVKACAATSEIRYVVSLLSYLNECMRARQDLFTRLGLQKLSELREAYGIVLPRVLLLVDEFQQMFLEATSRETSQIEDILMSIVKLGRATGFHLLFASQEMSGTLSAKAFANFKAKFALPCDAEVSSTVLGNSAASKVQEKGIVLANTTSGKEEDNHRYKVPFISDDVFYEYLSQMKQRCEKTGFSQIHKFYQEDSVKELSVLEDTLEKIHENRQENIRRNMDLFDILVLGESVVFNYKHYDYETVFVERGVRKNIGMFSPKVDDLVYVCKLLALNFSTSPNRDIYRHYVICRNAIIEKKYDIREDLEVENFSRTEDILQDIIQAVDKRKKEFRYLNQYNEDMPLSSFVKEAITFRYPLVYDEKIDDSVEELLTTASQYFDGYYPEDIPQLIELVSEKMNCDTSLFYLVDLLYQKEVEGKEMNELFPPLICWILGAETIDAYPRNFDQIMGEATNYNCLFILMSAGEYSSLDYHYKACDYLFISGNMEKYYDKFNIRYTRKDEKSIVIDFGIRSMVTERSFKKFKFTSKEIIVPEIDFDSIL